jgi:hypothetical protein
VLPLAVLPCLCRDKIFYPEGTGYIEEVGKGPGTGFNINIGWSKKGVGDLDYVVRINPHPSPPPRPRSPSPSRSPWSPSPLPSCWHADTHGQHNTCRSSPIPALLAFPMPKHRGQCYPGAQQFACSQTWMLTRCVHVLQMPIRLPLVHLSVSFAHGNAEPGVKLCLF